MQFVSSLQKASDEMSYHIEEIHSRDTEYIQGRFDDIMKAKRYRIKGHSLSYMTDYGKIRVDFKNKALYVYADTCGDGCDMIKMNHDVLGLMSNDLKHKIYSSIKQARIKLASGARE